MRVRSSVLRNRFRDSKRGSSDDKNESTKPRDRAGDVLWWQIRCVEGGRSVRCTNHRSKSEIPVDTYAETNGTENRSQSSTMSAAVWSRRRECPERTGEGRNPDRWDWSGSSPRCPSSDRRWHHPKGVERRSRFPGSTAWHEGG